MFRLLWLQVLRTRSLRQITRLTIPPGILILLIAFGSFHWEMSRKLGCDYLEFSYIYKTLLKWNLLSVGSKSNIVDNFIKLVRKWGGKGNAWKVHIRNFLHRRSNQTECLPFLGFQANSSLKFRIWDQGFGFFRFHELCLQTFSWNGVYLYWHFLKCKT